MPEEHAPTCDWDTYELCTCGAHLRAREEADRGFREAFEKNRTLERPSHKDERLWRRQRSIRDAVNTVLCWFVGGL